MKLVEFELSGRFAHFLRAEASASALTYAVPPRTVILGIVGAILGLPKDSPQVVLEPANISLRCSAARTHWHKAKLRKDPPESLARVIDASRNPAKVGRPEKATLIAQEWLFEPRYSISIALPEDYHEDLEGRLRERRWHFQPSLGLSEMMAQLDYTGSPEASLMPPGKHEIGSIFNEELGQVDFAAALTNELAVLVFKMPRTVTPDRVFSHASYFMERDGRPMPVETSHAYRVGDQFITFL